MEHRFKELDGIRGLAIALVVLFHTLKRADYFTANTFLHIVTDLSLLGWIGVDIFFVLSGFLITSILIRTKGGQHYFRNFYARRVLRIFPLYYAVLAAILLLFAVAQIDNKSDLLPRLPVYLLYQQNWLHLNAVQPSPYLAVTWSLAIEEQFYLIWPAVVYGLKKRTLALAGVVILAVIFTSRLLASLWLPESQAMLHFFYYGTFGRLEGLVVGALIALAMEAPGPWRDRLVRFAAPVLGLALPAFLLMALLGGGEVPHPLYGNIQLTIWGYSLIAAGSGALIVLVTTLHPESGIRRIFRTPLLGFLGKYSYAIYLFHVPILLLLLDGLWKTGYRGWSAYFVYAGLVCGLTILASLLSWNLLEKHALKLKRYFE